MRHWQARELALLGELRTRFLDRTAGAADYWRSDEELRLYDETFAARIGWKIDAALRGLRALGWAPRSRHLLDWGCGTGIASRRVLQSWPDFQRVSFFDRSERAVRFAQERIRAGHPQVEIQRASADRDTLLVISHVLNELPADALCALLAQIDAAGEVLWVEAGTHADSRQLSSIRERILSRPEPPAIVAPCTHHAPCGVLAPENAQHWCHHFARPPADVFQDARWAEWSRGLGIDLRALPYSHLVLTRHPWPPLAGVSRVLGGLRESKGYCRLLNCDATGVRELMLQKRDSPDSFRLLTRKDEWPPFAWQISGEKITAGQPWPSREDEIAATDPAD